MKQGFLDGFGVTFRSFRDSVGIYGLRYAVSCLGFVAVGPRVTRVELCCYWIQGFP